MLTGIGNKRQIQLGIYDLTLHRLQLDEGVRFDSTDIWYDVLYKITGEKATERTCFQAAFGHLMGGYPAGYYGYLRSETYAANMFYLRFKNGHVMDPEVGMRYRKRLLEPGSSKDGIDLLKDFLGEEPNDIYFLIDKGLEVAQDA